MGVARVVGLALLLFSFTTAPVRAAERKDEAREHNDRGVELLKQGELEGALREFRAAFELDPSADYILNIAIVYANMESYQDAVDYCDRYLAEGSEPAIRARVQSFKSDLEAKLALARGRVEVTSEPTGAFVSVGRKEDGALFRAPFQRWLEPGAHRLHFELEGFEPTSRNVEVLLGRTTHVKVVLKPSPNHATLTVDASVPRARVFLGERFVGLTPLDAQRVPAGEYLLRIEAPGHAAHEERVSLTVGAPTAVFGAMTHLPAPGAEPELPGGAPTGETQPSDGRTGFDHGLWGWVGVGVGAACLAGAAGLHVSASQRADDVDGIDLAQPQPLIQRRYDDISEDVDARMAGAWALYAVGGAAAVAGTVLLVLDATSDEEPRGTVTPVAMPGGAGLSATFAF